MIAVIGCGDPDQNDDIVGGLRKPGRPTLHLPSIGTIPFASAIRRLNDHVFKKNSPREVHLPLVILGSVRRLARRMFRAGYFPYQFTVISRGYLINPLVQQARHGGKDLYVEPG